MCFQLDLALAYHSVNVTMSNSTRFPALEELKPAFHMEHWE